MLFTTSLSVLLLSSSGCVLCVSISQHLPVLVFKSGKNLNKRKLNVMVGKLPPLRSLCMCGKTCRTHKEEVMLLPCR